MDTFIYDIQFKDFHSTLKLQEKFDTSDNKKDKPFNFPVDNKKVIGIIQDELSVTIMSELAVLKSNVYAYLKESDDEIKAKKK